MSQTGFNAEKRYITSKFSRELPPGAKNIERSTIESAIKALHTDKVNPFRPVDPATGEPITYSKFSQDSAQLLVDSFITGVSKDIPRFIISEQEYR